MLIALCAIAGRPSVRLSVRMFVCYTGGSVKTVEVRITKLRNFYHTVAPSL